MSSPLCTKSFKLHVFCPCDASQGRLDTFLVSKSYTWPWVPSGQQRAGLPQSHFCHSRERLVLIMTLSLVTSVSPRSCLMAAWCIRRQACSSFPTLAGSHSRRETVSGPSVTQRAPDGPLSDNRGPSKALTSSRYQLQGKTKPLALLPKWNSSSSGRRNF